MKHYRMICCIRKLSNDGCERIEFWVERRFVLVDNRVGFRVALAKIEGHYNP